LLGAGVAAAALRGATETAGHRLYACAAASKGYVVGAQLPPSGLFLRSPEGSWRHLGFTHPQLDALDYDPRDPRAIYLAAGNGCIRSGDGGATWAILTGWEITEPKDISIDRRRPDHVYLALPDGIAVSRDRGRTWLRKDEGIRFKYTQTILCDRGHAGRVLAGTERGIYLTEDAGRRWRLAGAEGAMVTDLEQSPNDALLWLATTQTEGLFVSHDRGRTWRAAGGIGPDAGTLHNAAFDPADPNRVAVCGWALGVAVSTDRGVTWRRQSPGESPHVWRVRFDPDRAGRLWAGVHEDALYVSEDAGNSWKSAGLEGTIVYDLAFVPSAGAAS
jgi:hypothetical protein